MDLEWFFMGNFTRFVTIYTKKVLKNIKECINKYKTVFCCILNSVSLMIINKVLMLSISIS